MSKTDSLATEENPRIEFSSDPAEIQAQLEATRLEMGRTVDELADRLSPQKQFQAVKQNVVARTQNTVQLLRETVSEAGEGDRAALTKIGAVAGGTVVVVAALTYLIIRKKHSTPHK